MSSALQCGQCVAADGANDPADRVHDADATFAYVINSSIIAIDIVIATTTTTTTTIDVVVTVATNVTSSHASAAGRWIYSCRHDRLGGIQRDSRAV